MKGRRIIDLLRSFGFIVRLDSTRNEVLIDPEPADWQKRAVMVNAEEIADILRIAGRQPPGTVPPAYISGASFMPWNPPQSMRTSGEWRQELVLLIKSIADIEGWTKVDLDDAVVRVTAGPSSDLLPSLHFFRDRKNQLAKYTETLTREMQQLLSKQSDKRSKP